jgi:cytochrome c oxidase cbb3-type subunit I/II
MGFMTFGMLYWLAPRLFLTEKLYSRKLAELHFWIGTLGILFYFVAIYAAGVTQGLMWRAFDETGRLAYPDFVETVTRLMPMYWVRVFGGGLYVMGVLLGGFNIFMTWRMRPEKYEIVEQEAPALGPYEGATPRPIIPAHSTISPAGTTLRYFAQAVWHRAWERKPLKLTVWVTVAVLVASLFEIIPTFLIRSNVPSISSVKPYTPLELYGRDIYIAEGCYNCHSQMIRPIRAETERYGEYSKPGEFVYDHPFQWGSRRIGPDLARVGGKYPHLWHVRHMANPTDTTEDSIMPRYPWMLTDEIEFDVIQDRVDVMVMLGVPYGDAVKNAEEMARAQAQEIAAEIQKQGGEGGYETKQIVALTAYLQRLGRDIQGAPASSADAQVAALVETESGK